MAYTDPNKTKSFENPMDNADLQMERQAKDIAAAYTEFDEMKAYKLYLETLELEARVGAATAAVDAGYYDSKGDWIAKPIKINELMPKASEFEKIRRMVIQKLNAKDFKQSDLKQAMAEFETDSIWELSSKITNFIIDKRRRDAVYTKFNVYAANDN